MFFCSDWARPVAMWLGVPVLLVADTGDFDSHTCQVCTKEPCAWGFHISHDLQLLIDSGDADALAALSDHTADTDGWDDEFLPGYASGASDDGDLF